MGGGHSDPASTQNDGVNITTTSGGHSANKYEHITVTGGKATQGATSTGAHVTVGVSATVPIPAML